MNRAEAEEICTRYADEHPDRKVAQWRPRQEADGSWSVMRVDLPPSGDLVPEQRADERPPTADDPRAAIFQNIPPYGAGF